MSRLSRWFGGAVLVAAAAGIAVLGPQFYAGVIKPATKPEWSDLSQAERDEVNKKAMDDFTTNQEDTILRSKMIARGEDPDMDPYLNRNNPEKLRQIQAKEVKELGDKLEKFVEKDNKAALVLKASIEDRLAKRKAMAENPDGNIFRMTPAEDAAAVAKIDAAFGGTSPFTTPEQMMHGPQPWFIRHTNLDVLGDDAMEAVISQSHPKSHFVIVNNMVKVDTEFGYTCIAAWVKGADNTVKIVFTSGIFRQAGKTLIAVAMKDGKEIGRQNLRPIVNTPFFVINDTPFTFLAIYEDIVDEAHMIYALEPSPALASRDKFFSAY